MIGVKLSDGGAAPAKSAPAPAPKPAPAPAPKPAAKPTPAASDAAAGAAAVAKKPAAAPAPAAKPAPAAPAAKPAAAPAAAKPAPAAPAAAPAGSTPRASVAPAPAAPAATGSKQSARAVEAAADATPTGISASPKVAEAPSRTTPTGVTASPRAVENAAKPGPTGVTASPRAVEAAATKPLRVAAAALPPVAGGAALNPRTSTPPPGTTAAEIDAKAPAADRAALKDAQARARQDADKARTLARRMGEDPTATYRDVLGSYYQDHAVHVDTDDTAYAASYDRTNGELTLQRNHAASKPSSAPAPGGLAPAAPLPAPGGVTPRPANQQSDVSDTKIVIGANGDRDMTVRRAPAQAQLGSDSMSTRHVVTSASGEPLSSEATRATTRIAADGTTTSNEASFAMKGTKVTSEASTTLVVSPGGDSVRTSGATTYGAQGDKMVRDEYAATHQGTTVSQQKATQFIGDTPFSTHVERTIGGDQRSTYDATYDEKGRVDTLQGTAPVNGRDPLDAALDAKFGPLQPGERRPAFGPVFLSTPPGDLNGATVHGTGYLSDPGVTAVVGGARVFVEDDPKQTQPLQARLDKLQSSLAAMPAKMRSGTNQVDLLKGAMPNYAPLGSGVDSGAVAMSGQYGVTFWGGNDAGEHVAFHEFAHASDKQADTAAWNEAMHRDQATGVAAQLGAQAKVQVITEGVALKDQLGATAYGNGSLASERSMGEDWADSAAMYLESRRNGGLVRVTDYRGVTETKQFEDVFPNRAKLLESYYHITENTPLAPAATSDEVLARAAAKAAEKAAAKAAEQEAPRISQ